MPVIDYVSRTGQLRVAHNGFCTTRSRKHVIGARNPGRPRYGPGSNYSSWERVRADENVVTEPLDSPKTVN